MTGANLVKFIGNEHPDFSGCTLLLPAVSVGNVGQLAVDLHLENLNPRPVKIGQLFHGGLEPVIGNAGDGSLLVACELFRQPERNLVILQFYSPVTKRSQGAFISFLVDWIKNSNFQEVICLGSSLASFRNDAQINASTVRFLAGSALDAGRIQAINTLGWTPLESPAAQDASTQIQNGGVNCSIPGGGIARDFFQACNAANIAILTLIIFASDGDNTPESTALFRSVNQLFNFVQSEARIRIPAAWEYFNGQSQLAPIF